MKIGAALIFALLICQGDKSKDQDRAEDGWHGEFYKPFPPKVRIWREFFFTIKSYLRESQQSLSVQVYYNESVIFS